MLVEKITTKSGLQLANYVRADGGMVTFARNPQNDEYATFHYAGGKAESFGWGAGATGQKAAWADVRRFLGGRS